MKRQQYYVDNDNDHAALIRCYAYLIRENCLWLAGMPGIDNRRLRATRQAQLRGEVWSIPDLIEMSRKQTVAFPTKAAPARAA